MTEPKATTAELAELRRSLSIMESRARGYSDRAQSPQESMELGAIALTLRDAAAEHEAVP